MDLIKKISKSFESRPYDIGVALGGGGTRGFAHLGVLQALKEANIQVEAVSGVSAGAIVGCMIASGKAPKEVMQLMQDYDLLDFTSFQIPKMGLLNFDKLEGFLSEHLPSDSFDDLEIPFWVTLSNLNVGKVEYHNSGSLITAVMASASIPVLFSPVTIGEYTYVDGGLFDNLPVQPLRDNCKKVIGVDISPVQEVESFSNLIDVAIRTFQLNDKSNTRKNKKECDLFIQPLDLCEYDILDTSNAKKLFDIGYDCANSMTIDL
ncbi:patatin-like phospholipase family protein [Sungkyunkwania multivorans]|uniref:Patatin-like phospholipase family protein n=1 Tax=Sungkyunkwania multivorans TaxID=1173618 RepID=A0ABW3CYY2_9FLAO